MESRQGCLSGLAAIATTICAVIVAVLAFFYVRSLRASGIHGRIGEIQNPESPPSEWRYVPAAGADILVIWNGTPLDNPVHGNSVCVRAAYARTNADGEFSLAGWWLGPQWPLMTDVYAMLPAPAIGFKYPRPVESSAAPLPSAFTMALVRVVDAAATEAGAVTEIDPIGLYRCRKPEPPGSAR